MSDFYWVPDYTLGSSSEWKTLESQMENGVKQYRQVWPTKHGRWTLVFTKRTLAVALAIQTFFDSKEGKGISFTWTHPRTNVEYTVRFAMDTFTYEEEQYDQCNFKIEFDEETV